MAELLTILLAAIFTHNIALTYLLGMCPVISLSQSLKTSFGMGICVMIVMTLTSAINWPIYKLILVPTHSEYFSFLVFIIIIAATVQLLEMVMEKYFPTLQSLFGVFLPLIAANSIVLVISIFMVLRNYSYIKTIVFSFGSAVGWMLAIVSIASIRARLLLIGDIPDGIKGGGITLIIAGIMALAFMGFSGIFGIG
ncbi:MAG: Rnf-Nqr domain containing protein [Elusimicrobia bacterium]|nr:Rnf-Nqr domain containing protein [Elusimicrobiota bacterium]